MPILTKEQFERLAKFDNKPCISIFLPTQRSGKDVLEEKDRIQLKSQWKKVYEKLKDMNLSQEQIDKLGEPVEELLADKSFWRHQSDGLAIFLADGFVEKFSLPINFEAFTYVADHFYLKPLVPMFSGDTSFYLLSLHTDSVKFYECTQYTIQEVVVDDLTPQRLEDRVGYDFEEKNRKHKTQNNMMGTATQHGYSPATRDQKNEVLRFFRAVDDGLQTVLHNKKAPMIVACQDYLFPIYQEATKYNNLYSKSVPGNPGDYENIYALHAAALDQLESLFNKDKEEKMEQFRELNPDRTSTRVSDILPAIYEGKVDTLFLQNREDIWGNYNEEMASVEVHDERRNGSLSLMNLAAIKVIEQGGQVYLIENQFMPDKSSRMNAVFRY